MKIRELLKALIKSNHVFAYITRLLVMFVVLVTAACMYFENDMIFLPSRDGHYDVDYGHRVAYVEFKASDGVTLHGAFCPADKARGTILWFHGNGGNLTYGLDQVRRFHQLGVSLFLFDYRGYGRSEGSPNGRGILLDAEAAYEYVTRTLKIPPSRLVFLGESMGGAPAIHLAARVECAGLVCQSNFTSIPDMALHRFPVFPWLYFCARTDFPNLDTIPKVRVPKLVIHSRTDEVVPYSMGEKLFQAAAEPKEFWEIRGAYHNDTFGHDDYYPRLRSFLDKVLAN